MPSGDCDVSVVMCTYNRATLLEGALKSLAELYTGDEFTYEILIVNNASTDNTDQVVRQIADVAGVPIRIVIEMRKGVTFARNRGIREARGEWIAFFDDDQIADPAWLTTLLRTAKENDTRYVAGAVRLLLDGNQLTALPAVCRRILGESIGLDKPQCWTGRAAGGTGNLLIHSSVFDEVGVFDEMLTEAGEDFDLNRRINDRRIPACYTPDAIVLHTVPEYRLKVEYFRWTSLRHGGHVARRDQYRFGRCGFPLVLLARVAQAGFSFLPKLAYSKLSRNQRSALASRCCLWRAEGCIRSSLHMLMPRIFTQRSFLAKLDFRGERSTFVHQ